MKLCTIQHGDTTFYCEGEYDEVCRAIVDGKPLEVWRPNGSAIEPARVYERITFFNDVDWVSVEL